MTESDESGRVTFTLRGINEPITGDGSFLAAAQTENALEILPDIAVPNLGVFTRLREAIARLIYQRIFGRRVAVVSGPVNTLGIPNGDYTMRRLVMEVTDPGFVSIALVEALGNVIAIYFAPAFKLRERNKTGYGLLSRNQLNKVHDFC